MPRMKLDDAAARLEALGNPTRLKIYRALVRAGAEGLPVGRLQERCPEPAEPVPGLRGRSGIARAAAPRLRQQGVDRWYDRQLEPRDVGEGRDLVELVE